jgi:hypothetical protein
MTSISSVNIASAALVTQCSLCVIMLIAALVIVHRNIIIVIVALLSLFTMGTLILSVDLLSLARVLFGNASLGGFQTSTVLCVNLILTILVLGSFIFITGGITSSPFSPIIFTIIPLAIFLREPLSHIIWYLLMIISASLICFSPPDPHRWVFARLDFESKDEPRSKLAYVLSAVLCLLLTTFVGWVTRTR